MVLRCKRDNGTPPYTHTEYTHTDERQHSTIEKRSFVPRGAYPPAPPLDSEDLALLEDVDRKPVLKYVQGVLDCQRTR